MTKIKSYAAASKEADLKQFEIERRDVLDDDVKIDILYCGVCHSDLHQVRNDWKNSVYPVVPGHEIIGKVMEVGKNVSKFKKGDLVGVGWTSTWEDILLVVTLRVSLLTINLF